MTREEAKRVLEFDLDHTYNNESKEALRMAIKALKQDPCEDAISRSEVIKSIDEREDVNGKVDAESVRTDIVLIPPVNPQPKTGHWIISPNDCFVHCSECGLHGDKGIYKHYRWCPNCGAKMIEPQERSE